MICYLPFSHISATPFEGLAKALGPLAVYLPSAVRIPSAMLPWQEKGWITIHTPPGLDENRLLSQLQAFKSWAQLHDGHIGDMVSFFNTRQGRPPMVDETAPSQIRTQVRHFGEDVAGNDDGLLVQAALFLSLAQEYDQHQERLGTDLTAVAGMEKAMFANIGGGSDHSETMGGALPGSGDFPSAEEDPGGHMTEQRLKAWTRIAFSEQPIPEAYVTPSFAVFDYLKGLMPEAIDLSTWHINRQGDHQDLKQQRRKALETISSAENIKDTQLDLSLCGLPAHEGMMLEWVGCAGFQLEKLLPVQYAPEIPANTVVGFIRPAN